MRTRHNIDARRSAAALALSIACAQWHQTQLPATPPVLLPGSQSLSTPTLTPTRSAAAVFVRRPASDTTPHLWAHVAYSEQTSPANRRLAVLTTDWAPPLQSSDTLTIDPRSLRPIDEVLTFNHVRSEYHYQAARVTGTIQVPDSAPQRFDQTYETPMFAFNEVESLVRSLTYHAGLRVVVPLFSEVDRDVEHDTLTVTGRTTVGGAEAWIVMFGDPMVTTRYLVDARSRRILDAVTTQRKSRVEFRYQYGPEAANAPPAL